MALVNKNEGLKEEYPMDKTFSAEYDFSCVRQIARADRFARAIARVKRKGLQHFTIILCEQKTLELENTKIC